jgi:uncharacterized membrane protein YbjE (DUF340 family)
MFDAPVAPTSSITVATIFNTFRPTTVFFAFPWLALSIFGATRLDTELVKPSMTDAFPWLALSIFGATRLDTELAFSSMTLAFPWLALSIFGATRLDTELVKPPMTDASYGSSVFYVV